MARTLREYTALFVLVSLVSTGFITFAFGSTGVIGNYDSNVDNSKVEKINDELGENAPQVRDQVNKSSGITLGTKTGFFPAALGVVQTTLSTVTSIPKILTLFAQELGLPEWIVGLAALPIIGVIYEIVTIIKGIRT